MQALFSKNCNFFIFLFCRKTTPMQRAAIRGRPYEIGVPGRHALLPANRPGIGPSRTPAPTLVTAQRLKDNLARTRLYRIRAMFCVIISRQTP